MADGTNPLKRQMVVVKIKELKVLSNGDHKKKPDSGDEENNAVVATLEYPRAGASEVVSTFPVNLQNKKKFTPTLSNFWKSGLFKEELVDQARLRVKITDRDEPSKFAQVFGKLFGALMGVGVGGLNPILGAIVGVGIAEAKTSLTDGDAKIDFIAESPATVLKVGSIKDEITLKFTAPADIKKKTVKLKSNGQAEFVETTVIKKGQANGYIKLELSKYPV